MDFLFTQPKTFELNKLPLFIVVLKIAHFLMIFIGTLFILIKNQWAYLKQIQLENTLKYCAFVCLKINWHHTDTVSFSPYSTAVSWTRLSKPSSLRSLCKSAQFSAVQICVPLLHVPRKLKLFAQTEIVTFYGSIV